MVRPHLETVYEAAVQAKRPSQEIKQLEKVPLNRVVPLQKAFLGEKIPDDCARFSVNAG
jgi:hypothetical protein